MRSTEVPQVAFVYERRVTRTASVAAAAAESATVTMLASVADMAVVMRSFVSAEPVAVEASPDDAEPRTTPSELHAEAALVTTGPDRQSRR